MASGGLYTPLVARFVQNSTNFAYEILTMSLSLLKKKIQGSSCPRELSRDLFWTKSKRKFVTFEVLRAYLREFSISFHEILMIARFLRDLAADIKDLPSALLSLETRLKVKILAIFDDFWLF